MDRRQWIRLSNERFQNPENTLEFKKERKSRSAVLDPAFSAMLLQHR